MESQSAIEVVSQRVTTLGPSVLAECAKSTSEEEKLAKLTGFFLEVFAGVPGVGKVLDAVLAKSAWFGMASAIRELDSELIAVSERDALLSAFEGVVEESHGETVRAIGTMLSNHEEMLVKLLEGIVIAQMTKVLYDDDSYRLGLMGDERKKFERLYFKFENRFEDLFDKMDECRGDSRDNLISFQDSIFNDFSSAVRIDPDSSLGFGVELLRATFNGQSTGLDLRGGQYEGKK